MVKRNRIALSSYKAYCKALNCLLNIAEEEYLGNNFASLRYDIKKNWRLLNNMLDKNVKSSHRELLINGIKTEDENIISKSFCEYFIEYSKSIHHSITTSQHDFSSIIPVNLNSNVFKRSSLVEITNMID